MVKLSIIDQDGRVLSLKDLATAAELIMLAEQARSIIRDCEQLAREKAPRNTANGSGQTPYLS